MRNASSIMRDGRGRAGGQRPLTSGGARPTHGRPSFSASGRDVAVQVDQGVLETPWGRFPAPSDVPSGPVDLVFRADALSLASDGVIAGHVSRVTFGGAEVVVTVQPETGTPLVVRVAQQRAPAPGERVRLSVQADALLCYPSAD